MKNMKGIPLSKRKKLFFSIFQFSYLKVYQDVLYPCCKVRTIPRSIVPENPKFPKASKTILFLFLSYNHCGNKKPKKRFLWFKFFSKPVFDGKTKPKFLCSGVSRQSVYERKSKSFPPSFLERLGRSG